MDLYKNSEITVIELKKRIDLDPKIVILDVREDNERKHVYIKGSKHIKLSELSEKYEELDKEKNIFVHCHIGVRSQSAVNWLKNKGYKVVTKLLPYQTFWIAEEYHQNYYKKKSGTPYCHFYTKRLLMAPYNS